jgi:hypothetical protein
MHLPRGVPVVCGDNISGGEAMITKVFIYRSGPFGWYYSAWAGDNFDHVDALDVEEYATTAEAMLCAREVFPHAEVEKTEDL